MMSEIIGAIMAALTIKDGNSNILNPSSNQIIYIDHDINYAFSYCLYFFINLKRIRLDNFVIKNNF